MAAHTLLFDVEGVLVDSHPLYCAALHAGAGLDPFASAELLRAGHNVVRLAREAGISDSRFGRLCREAVAELRLYPEVVETLQELGGRNVRMGVVTNLPRRLIEPALVELGLVGYFASRIYAARKPAGAGLLKAFAELGRCVGEGVYYVGDTETDALAATRAGVAFAWASYGYSGARPAQAVAALGCFADVLGL